MNPPLIEPVAGAIRRLHPSQPRVAQHLADYAHQLPPLAFAMQHFYGADPSSFVSRFLPEVFAGPRFEAGLDWPLTRALSVTRADVNPAPMEAGSGRVPLLHYGESESEVLLFMPIGAFLGAGVSSNLDLSVRLLVDTQARNLRITVLSDETFRQLHGWLTRSKAGTETVKPRKPGAQENAAARDIVAQILDEAIEAAASDIHIDPPSDEFEGTQNWLKVRVALRVHGDLIPHRPETLYEIEFHDAVTRVFQERCQLEKLPGPQALQQGMFTDRAINWRVQIIPAGRFNRPSVTVRLLDPSSVLKPLDRIFLHDRLKRDIRRLQTHVSSGLVLVTGVTGSGKTTTLYSLLRDSYLKAEGQRVIKTIEDPIEYPMPWLVQHQVTPRTPAASILKALLRADPDWIFVGEIRDRELLEPAIHAALSGHLTLASFHAAGVKETLVRLHELGVSYADLARSVRLILSQSLVKTLCPKCRIAEEGGTYRLGHGCEHCQWRQHSGRLCLVEYLLAEEGNAYLQAAIADQDFDTLSNLLKRKFLTKSAYAQWAVEQGLMGSNDPTLNLVRL